VRIVKASPLKAEIMTRRSALLAGASALAWAAGGDQSRLSVEGYIFQQYAQRKHKKLADVLPEVIPMARNAGFHNIELNAEFFAPDVKATTLELVRSNGLRMPSVYIGGPMHESALADATVPRVLEIGKICQPFGCVAIVFNANPKGDGVQKTDDELDFQSQALNRMGRMLSEKELDLRVHNHIPEMTNGAREWRNTLQKTDPKFVSLCLDLDWVEQGGQEPLALLKEAGSRVHEIHARSSRNKLWLEAFGPGDIDYSAVAEYLKQMGTKPLVAVELAYRENTVVTRPLDEDLRISREYAEKVFGLTV
jgi:inosose dehydratase